MPPLSSGRGDSSRGHRWHSGGGGAAGAEEVAERRGGVAPGISTPSTPSCYSAGLADGEVGDDHLRHVRRRRGTSCSSNKGPVSTVYRECLKNHAASLGGKALDGCGEFMPGGAKGTMEAFWCSACGYHYNFHGKVVEGELLSYDSYRSKGRKLDGQKGVLISTSDACGHYPASNGFMISVPSPHHMIMPLGALQSYEWPEELVEGGGGSVGVPTTAAPLARKRFRTKFTAEQKEKMLAFGEKMGWRLQREEEGLVQQLCQEIGVKRRVLKVWMHNNKQNLAVRKK